MPCLPPAHKNSAASFNTFCETERKNEILKSNQFQKKKKQFVLTCNTFNEPGGAKPIFSRPPTVSVVNNRPRPVCLKPVYTFEIEKKKLFQSGRNNFECMLPLMENFASNGSYHGTGLFSARSHYYYYYYYYYF